MRISQRSRRIRHVLASSSGAHHQQSGGSTFSDDESAATSFAHQNGAAAAALFAEKVRGYAEVAYLTGRTKVVVNHFNTAMGIDDFLHRLEIALYAYGFNGDNSIGTFVCLFVSLL